MSIRRRLLILLVLAADAAIILGPGVAAIGAQVQWPENSEPFHISPPGEFSRYLAYGLGSLWLTDTDAGKIWRIDPSTGAVLSSLDSSWGGGIAFDGECLWKAARTAPTIRRIRPGDGTTVREIPGVGTEQSGLAWDGTHLWIADESTGKIYRLNPNTGAQVSSFDCPGPAPRGLAWWNGYLYQVDSHECTIYQLDPVTGEIISKIVAPGSAPQGLSFDGACFWSSDYYQGVDRLVVDVSPDGRVIRSSPCLMMAEMTGSVTNVAGPTIDSLKAHWLFPAQDENHILIERTFDPSPDSWTTNEFGDVAAQFSSLSPLAPGATQDIVCRSYEKIWRVNYQIDPAEVGPLSSIPDAIMNRYLADHSTLHITDPEIVGAAAAAVGDETNPYLIAVRIHDYVAAHMTYDKEAGIPQDALEALRAGRGVCGHFAVLFTALGRAIGLPTRYVAGFFFSEDSSTAGDHAWVETFIPDYGWISFDSTGDDRSPMRHTYVGCEPLEIISYRGGGTCVAGPCGAWRGWGWDTQGVQYSTDKAFSGSSPLRALSTDASSGARCGETNLSWKNPPASDLARIVVRRTTQRYPASQLDGVLVYQTTAPTPGATLSLVGTGLSPQEKYYYAVFAQSSTGLWNSSVVQGENADETYPGNTGTASVFRVDGTGSVLADGSFYGAAFLSGSADVAEWVPVSEAVEAGTVLELDTVHPGSYRLSQESCSSLVAGVVSTQPAITLGATPGGPQKALLALSGIVPVKVTNEGGPIQPGDLLVSSSTPGYAMRWAGPEPCPCALVGKALEAMTDERGVILVLLTCH